MVWNTVPTPLGPCSAHPFSAALSGVFSRLSVTGGAGRRVALLGDIHTVDFFPPSWCWGTSVRMLVV